MTTLRETIAVEMKSKARQIANCKELFELHKSRLDSFPEAALDADLGCSQLYENSIIIPLGEANQDGSLPQESLGIVSRIATSLNTESGKWEHSYGNCWELRLDSALGIQVVFTKTVPTPCHVAIVKKKISWCGDPPADVEILEYVEEG